MQALTAAANSGNMDLLDWMMGAFNVTLTGDEDNRVGNYVVYILIRACCNNSMNYSQHSVEFSTVLHVRTYIQAGSCVYY